MQYSVGSTNSALNDNLLTVIDPHRQTSARFTYSPTLVSTDVNFDRVLSVQVGNIADPIDKPTMFFRLTQTPLPSNGYAVLKRILDDPVGNVARLFRLAQLPVRSLDYTGRATPAWRYRDGEPAHGSASRKRSEVFPNSNRMESQLP